MLQTENASQPPQECFFKLGYQQQLQNLQTY